MSNRRKIITTPQTYEERKRMIFNDVKQIDIDNVDVSQFDINDKRYGVLVGLKLKRMEQVIKQMIGEIQGLDSIIAINAEIIGFLANKLGLTLDFMTLDMKDAEGKILVEGKNWIDMVMKKNEEAQKKLKEMDLIQQPSSEATQKVNETKS